MAGLFVVLGRSVHPGGVVILEPMNKYGVLACAAYAFYAISLWNYSLWRAFWYADYVGWMYALIGIGVLIASLVTKTKPIPYGAIAASVAIGAALTVVDDRSFSQNTGWFMGLFVAITAFFIYRATRSEVRLGTIFDIVLAVFFSGLCIRIALDPYMVQKTFFKGLGVLVGLNGLAYLIPTLPNPPEPTEP